MTIGAKIKEIRKRKKISVESLAKQIGVSKTTIYRYEDSTIEKIPVQIIDKLCITLGVTLAELTGNEIDNKNVSQLPSFFDNPQDAMEFIIKTPTLAAFGGYDQVMDAYHVALKEGYRFGTYGDAMLILDK